MHVNREIKSDGRIRLTRMLDEPRRFQSLTMIIGSISARPCRFQRGGLLASGSGQRRFSSGEFKGWFSSVRGLTMRRCRSPWCRRQHNQGKAPVQIQQGRRSGSVLEVPLTISSNNLKVRVTWAWPKLSIVAAVGTRTKHLEYRSTVHNRPSRQKWGVSSITEKKNTI